MAKHLSILQLIQKFPNEQACVEHLTKFRWNGKVICPHCNNQKVYTFKDNKTYKCGACRKKFNVKTNTIFENTKISLQVWLIASYLLSSHKKGISSLQLAKDLNITQKTAWFILHRLRYASQTESFANAPRPKLKGEVEADETYVGGKNKNRHSNKKVKGTQGRSCVDKTPVIGVVERNGELRAFVVEDVQTETLERIVLENVDTNAILNTDEYVSYKRLSEVMKHKIVNHGSKEFVNDNCHTNTLEGFWSLLKRGVIGIYHFTSRKHLNKYVSEFEFRYNNRNISVEERFNSILVRTNNKRLKYKVLIGKK